MTSTRCLSRRDVAPLLTVEECIPALGAVCVARRALRFGEAFLVR